MFKYTFHFNKWQILMLHKISLYKTVHMLSLPTNSFQYKHMLPLKGNNTTVLFIKSVKMKWYFIVKKNEIIT